MEELLSSLIKKTRESGQTYRPRFYRISEKSDRQLFDKLLVENPNIRVFDEIENQLGELVKSLMPKVKFDRKGLSEQIQKHTGNVPLNEYGVWVYYPWSSRVVHILDEKEFREVRTNRNQYKITAGERDLLAAKKVGVVGLSVGQSVAVTMAMERCFGEIRLADFDILELSNLNRIRTGLHNLGIPKVISVAREIAEIDPFLKVNCFTEGLTQDNVDRFLLDDGKLDMLIDECDSIDMKVMCRLKARENSIPLVMEASDRGCIDIERYDLEPKRPIFHGYLDHLDISQMKGLTNEEKIPYLISIHPPDSLSKRIKASMMEVDETITTWPQLASAVTLGGALATDVCRRIMLGQFKSSGRYFVDLEELISDGEMYEVVEAAPAGQVNAIGAEEMRKLTELARNTIGSDFPLVEGSILEELVGAAITAPTGGNSQPWKWFYSEGLLTLFLDKSRSTSYMDYKDVASYLGLGAALENLVLQANKKNLDAIITLFPLGDEKALVAAISIKPLETTYKYASLAEGIFNRCTNRIISSRKPLPQQFLPSLTEFVSDNPTADLRFIESPAELAEIAEIVAMAERVRMLNPVSHRDFFVNELRWDTAQSELTNDGVDLMTMNLTRGENSGLHIAKDPGVMSLLRKWKIGGGLLRIRRKTVNAASAIGLISMELNNEADYVDAGRIMERVWLAATQAKVAFQPLYVPIMLFQRLADNDSGLPDDLKEDVINMKNSFLRYFPVKGKAKPIMLFRLCIAENPGIKSLRRPVREVLYL